MRTRTGGLLTLVLGAALAACTGAGERTVDRDAAAALPEATPEQTGPEPPDEATPPEPPIPPGETPPDADVPNMRPDPLPPGQEPPTTPQPATSGR